jgi:hypothetical protein
MMWREKEKLTNNPGRVASAENTPGWPARQDLRTPTDQIGISAVASLTLVSEGHLLHGHLSPMHFCSQHLSLQHIERMTAAFIA